MNSQLVCTNSVQFHIICRGGRLSDEITTALKWWLAVLQLNISEEYPWEEPSSPPALLFVDARGVPPRCAAVLFIDNTCLYTDGCPSEKIMQQFQSRCDNQITTLEILAVSVGLSTFCDELAGRRVVVFNDNRGAEACLHNYTCTTILQHFMFITHQGTVRKGASKAWDQSKLIHEIWTLVSFRSHVF